MRCVGGQRQIIINMIECMKKKDELYLIAERKPKRQCTMLTDNNDN